MQFFKLQCIVRTDSFWLDAIHYKVKDNGHYKSKAVHTVLAVNLKGKKGKKGKKEIHGLYLFEVWPGFMQKVPL